jgi:hypothetical protein
LDMVPFWIGTNELHKIFELLIQRIDSIKN